MDDNLFADVVQFECPYGLFDSCYNPDVSIKDCLLCHRGNMNEARRKYLDFYNNVYLKELKGGSADGKKEDER